MNSAHYPRWLNQRTHPNYDIRMCESWFIILCRLARERGIAPADPEAYVTRLCEEGRIDRDAIRELYKIDGRKAVVRVWELVTDAP